MDRGYIDMTAEWKNVPFLLFIVIYKSDNLTEIRTITIRYRHRCVLQIN